MLRRKDRAHLRLVVSNASVQKQKKSRANPSRYPRLAAFGRSAKVKGKGLNRVDSGVQPLLAGYLLDAPLGDAGVLSDTGPLPFTLLQLVNYVAMDGLGHMPDNKPVFGLMQPEKGGDSSLRLLPMTAGRPQKAVTPKDIIGQILIDNVKARWHRAFSAASSDKERLEHLARRSGVGKETLRKMMKGEQSPRIDTVDKVARALGTTCDELLRVTHAGERAA